MNYIDRKSQLHILLRRSHVVAEMLDLDNAPIPSEEGAEWFVRVKIKGLPPSAWSLATFRSDEIETFEIIHTPRLFCAMAEAAIAAAHAAGFDEIPPFIQCTPWTRLCSLPHPLHPYVLPTAMHPASCSLIIRDLLLLVDGTLDTKNGFLTITHRRDDQVPVECDYKLEALLDPGALNSNIFYVLAINAWATEDAYDADQNLVQPYLPDSIPRWFFDKHALWESTQDQWRPYVQVDGG